jgi:glycogen debranching enzyme
VEGPTDFRQGLTARTSFDGPGLDLCFPVAAKLRFLLPADARGWITGDALEIGPLRGALADAHHLLLKGPCHLESTAPGLRVETRGDTTLIGTESAFDLRWLEHDVGDLVSARLAWISSFTFLLEGETRRTRTVVKSLSLLKTMVYSPEGRIPCRWTTPDRWPHRRMWLWDSGFHAIGLRHLDPSLAREALEAVLACQGSDGMIPITMDPYENPSHMTQPPVLADAAARVNEIAPSTAWIASVYPKLCAYVRWDLLNRDSDGGGLVEWDIEGNPECRSGESGMDNSPRFDAATRMDAVDFNCLLARECEVLADLALLLDLAEASREWRTAHETLCRNIRDRLWSAEQAFFVDYDLDAGAASRVMACSGFLPLYCGAATPAQAEHLRQHLLDPQSFGTAFPVPSISASDTAHYQKDMWKGPTWVNYNWMIAHGLRRYGHGQDADRLLRQTLDVIEAENEKYGVIFEYYDDRMEVDPPKLLRKTKCSPGIHPHQVIHDYGWSATLYLDIWRTLFPCE